MVGLDEEQEEAVNESGLEKEEKNDYCKEHKKDTDQSKKVPTNEASAGKGSLKLDQNCTGNSEDVMNES